MLSAALTFSFSPFCKLERLHLKWGRTARTQEPLHYVVSWGGPNYVEYSQGHLNWLFKRKTSVIQSFQTSPQNCILHFNFSKRLTRKFLRTRKMIVFRLWKSWFTTIYIDLRSFAFSDCLKKNNYPSSNRDFNPTSKYNNTYNFSLSNQY